MRYLAGIIAIVTLAACIACAAFLMSPEVAQAAEEKPHIVVIWGDDIGITNLSCYSRGLMGYKTPNIDRIAQEGMLFTDYYAEQSCTAGRSTFITGQTTLRTGLSKVGLPGAKVGLQPGDATIAELLQNHGYVSGQIGKNHLGDRDEFLPTNHGFEEFYGNLYHLNAEEEPENRDYPKSPEFRKKFGPRGVIHSFANGKIEDTGPLTRKRMVTIDDDIAERACKFLDTHVKAGKPVFLWVCFTHMHFRTHTKPESVEQSGRWQSAYHDTMIDHDKNVGQVLSKIDELGIKDKTIVIYGTDNGPHMNTWPDGAMTPFRNEKNSGWEGAFRVPFLVRWPSKIKAGSVSNEMMSNLDWLPTLLAAAGDPDIKAKLLKGGHEAAGKTFKVHLDGYNFLPYLTGKAAKGPRDSFFYFDDEGGLFAFRYDNWKMHFKTQDAPGTLLVWAQPYTKWRIPLIFNLRLDPFERANITSNTYWDWLLDRAFLLVPAQAYVGNFLKTFVDFPPSQTPDTFSMDQVLDQLKSATSGR